MSVGFTRISSSRQTKKNKNFDKETSGFIKQLAWLMSPSLFWDVTQRRLVVTDVSGQLIGPSFKGLALGNLLLKMRPTDCPKSSATTNLRFETSQKSEEIIYTAAEA